MKSQPVYWKMRNGKSISIDDMDLNHLRNVLKMIVRNSQKHKTKVQAEKSFQLNGDMANEFNESQTCPYCGKMQDSLECCGFDATESDIY
jgi:hypothetical protein